MTDKKTISIDLACAVNLVRAIDSAMFMTMNKERQQAVDDLRKKVNDAVREEERRQREMNHEQ